MCYYVADWCFSPCGADLFGVLDVCQFNFNWLKCLGVLADHVLGTLLVVSQILCLFGSGLVVDVLRNVCVYSAAH